MDTLQFYLVHRKHLNHLEFILIYLAKTIRKLKFIEEKERCVLRNRKNLLSFSNFNNHRTIRDYFLISRNFFTFYKLCFFKETISQTPIKRITLSYDSDIIELIGCSNQSTISKLYGANRLYLISNLKLSFLKENKSIKKQLSLKSAIAKDSGKFYSLSLLSIEGDFKKVNLLEELEEHNISSEEPIIDLTIKIQCTV